MKLSEMKEIAENRENVTGFLHHTDMAVIEGHTGFSVSRLSFDGICEKTISKYVAKEITNKQASAVFEILAAENTQFKIERYRKNGSFIFEYDIVKGAYVCKHHGSSLFLKRLIKENGKYI